MNRERSHWLAIGMLLTSLASVVLGVAALSGFGSAASGDMVVPSIPGTTNMLLAFGAAAILALEYAHVHHRPNRAARLTSARAAFRP